MSYLVKKPNYNLRFRLENLPQALCRLIRADFNQLYRNPNTRWIQILDGLSTDLRSQEALIMVRQIGCTLDELLNPAVDLLQIYLERKKDPGDS